MNSLTWGLDNRIHGAKGHGGTITSIAAPDDPPLDLRGRDFSFDPRTHHMRAESGGGKQGLSFDDYGRKFVCTQTNAVQMLMYEDRYAGRNPHYSPPPARVDIALEANETNDRQLVHRISPEDPWRRIRNRWRAEGVFAGPPPQPPAYLIASSGVTVYRGDLFPPEYQHSVVRRRCRQQPGPPSQPGAERRRISRESPARRIAGRVPGLDRPLVSTRRIRERAGRRALRRRPVPGDPRLFGRDPRIHQAIQGSQPWQRSRPHLPRRPGRLPAVTRAAPRSIQHRRLVTTLEHPNAWHRETASRLLYSRQDKSAIPDLARLSETSSSPLGRLHALYALDGLDALAESYVLRRSTTRIRASGNTASGSPNGSSPRTGSPRRCGGDSMAA